MSNRAWVECKDAEGTKCLTKGERYLVEFRGRKAKVLQSRSNPHRGFGNLVNKDRFKSIEAPEDIAKRIIVDHIPYPPYENCPVDGLIRFHPDWDIVCEKLYNETGLGEEIISRLKQSEWYDSAHEEACREYYDDELRRKDINAYYGVPFP